MMAERHKVETVATETDVMAALHEARVGVPAVVRSLMSYFDIKGGDLASALHVSRGAISMRLTGATVIKQEELAALAVYFGVPIDVFYARPDDALRWVIDHRQEVEESRVRSRCCSAAA